MTSLVGPIVQMLEESITRLKIDLSPLEQQMLMSKQGIFITYKAADVDDAKIVIYSPLQYKAYIPKKYDGWPVHFVEWNGEDLQIDLDTLITTG